MKHLKNQQGLTLIETIVALVLILLLVTAFAGALTVGLQREVEVDISLKASSLASSIFEHLGDNRIKIEIIEDNYENEINLLNFYNLVDSYNDSVEDDEDEININDFDVSDLDFSYLDEEESKIKILDTQHNGIDNLYKINVKIVWDERDYQRDYDLISLLYMI